MECDPMAPLDHDYSRIAVKYEVPSMSSFLGYVDATIVYSLESNSNVKFMVKKYPPKTEKSVYELRERTVLHDIKYRYLQQDLKDPFLRGMKLYNKLYKADKKVGVLDGSLTKETMKKKLKERTFIFN